MASTAADADTVKININTSDADAALLNLSTQILVAAAKHDRAQLRSLIRSQENEALVPKGGHPVNLKDPRDGTTALHAAVGRERKGEGEGEGEDEVIETVRWLLGEGAIWNDLNGDDETPGCVAKRLGMEGVYREFVDAGVRAELLMGRLEGYEELAEDEEEEKEEGNEAQESHQQAQEDQDNEQGASETAIAAHDTEGDENATKETTDNNAYLDSTLTFTPNRLLDADSNGVMMSWETDIMRRSVSSLIPPTPNQEPLRILNIGHGMGIIDTFFQSSHPAEHHIVEAHPAVLDQMRATGWHEKPGVTVHSGKWQEVLPSLVSAGTTFDVIYYDTFAESYSDFRDFFSEHVIALLNPERGRWSFFNGMGADRQIAYDVYQKVVEIDLLETGFDVEWEEIDVPDLGEKGEWDGVKRAYWAIDKYRLPICKFAD